MVARDKRVNIRMSEREVQMLEALAEAEGVGVSEFLRSQVRRLFDSAGLRPVRAAKKGRKS